VKWLAQFGKFWYDFLIGDDWRLAVGVVAAISGLLRRRTPWRQLVVVASLRRGVAPRDLGHPRDAPPPPLTPNPGRLDTSAMAVFAIANGTGVEYVEGQLGET